MIPNSNKQRFKGKNNNTNKRRIGIRNGQKKLRIKGPGFTKFRPKIRQKKLVRPDAKNDQKRQEIAQKETKLTKGPSQRPRVSFAVQEAPKIDQKKAKVQNQPRAKIIIRDVSEERIEEEKKAPKENPIAKLLSFKNPAKMFQKKPKKQNPENSFSEDDEDEIEGPGKDFKLQSNRSDTMEPSNLETNPTFIQRIFFRHFNPKFKSEAAHINTASKIQKPSSLPAAMRIQALYETYQAINKKIQNRSQNTFANHLLYPILRTTSKDMSIAIILSFIYNILAFTPPFLTKQLLDELIYKSAVTLRCVYLVAMITVGVTLQSILFQNQEYYRKKAKAASSQILRGVFYQKLKNADYRFLYEADAGFVSDILHVEIDRMADFIGSIPNCVTAPVSFLISYVFIYVEIGYRVWLPSTIFLGLLSLSILIKTYNVRKINSYVVMNSKRADLLNEMLPNIRAVKLYSMEYFFLALLKKVRSSEAGTLRFIHFTESVVSFVEHIMPVMCALGSIVFYNRSTGTVLGIRGTYSIISVLAVTVKPFKRFSRAFERFEFYLASRFAFKYFLDKIREKRDFSSDTEAIWNEMKDPEPPKRARAKKDSSPKTKFEELRRRRKSVIKHGILNNFGLGVMGFHPESQNYFAIYLKDCSFYVDFRTPRKVLKMVLSKKILDLSKKSNTVNQLKQHHEELKLKRQKISSVLPYSQVEKTSSKLINRAQGPRIEQEDSTRNENEVNNSQRLIYSAKGERSKNSLEEPQNLKENRINDENEKSGLIYQHKRHRKHLPEASDEAEGQYEYSLINQSFNLQKILENVNLEIKVGQKVAIVGRSGSGKNTLIYSLLHETTLASGVMQINGKISYLSQNWPSIIPGTLRENILIGSKFDRERYTRVLNLLEFNIQKLPGKDFVQILEDTGNLADDDRRRMLLARMLYNSADIYIMDDVLDSFFKGEKMRIFEKILFEELEDKTVVLMTRDVRLLRKMDQIVVLRKGRITGVGTYHDLAKNKQSGFYELAKRGRREEMSSKNKIISLKMIEATPPPGSRKKLEVGRGSRLIGRKSMAFTPMSLEAHRPDLRLVRDEDLFRRVMEGWRSPRDGEGLPMTPKKGFSEVFGDSPLLRGLADYMGRQRYSIQSTRSKISSEQMNSYQRISISSGGDQQQILDMDDQKPITHQNTAKRLSLGQVVDEDVQIMLAEAQKQSKDRENKNSLEEEKSPKHTNLLLKKIFSTVQKHYLGTRLTQHPTLLQQTKKIKFSEAIQTLYFNAGTSLSILVPVLFLARGITFMVLDLWIGSWSTQLFNFSTNTYYLVYLTLSFMAGATLMISSMVFKTVARMSLWKFYTKILKDMLKNNLEFFSENPSNRLIYMLTEEFLVLDLDLMSRVETTFSTLFLMIGGIIMLVYLTYGVFAFICLFLAFYLYKTVKRNLKLSLRILDVSAKFKTELTATLLNVISCCFTLRNMEKGDFFDERFNNFSDVYQNATSSVANMCHRWLGTRVYFVVVIQTFFCYSYAILAILIWPAHFTDNLWIVTLTFLWTSKLSAQLSLLIPTLVQARNWMVSYFRISAQFEPNSRLTADKLAAGGRGAARKIRIRRFDLSTRAVEFKNVSFYYNRHITVLKNLNLEIMRKEKVAIIGKAGSGKRTFINLLLGLYESDKLCQKLTFSIFEENGEFSGLQSGRSGVSEPGGLRFQPQYFDSGRTFDPDDQNPVMKVFGHDLKNLDLISFRRHIEYLRNDPKLFYGTLRTNIDPYNEFTDQQIFKAMHYLKIIEYKETRDIEELLRLNKGNQEQGLYGGRPRSGGGGSQNELVGPYRRGQTLMKRNNGPSLISLGGLDILPEAEFGEIEKFRADSFEFTDEEIDEDDDLGAGEGSKEGLMRAKSPEVADLGKNGVSNRIVSLENFEGFDPESDGEEEKMGGGDGKEVEKQGQEVLGGKFGLNQAKFKKIELFKKEAKDANDRVGTGAEARRRLSRRPSKQLKQSMMARKSKRMIEALNKFLGRNQANQPPIRSRKRKLGTFIIQSEAPDGEIQQDVKILDISKIEDFIQQNEIRDAKAAQAAHYTIQKQQESRRSSINRLKAIKSRAQKNQKNSDFRNYTFPKNDTKYMEHLLATKATNRGVTKSLKKIAMATRAFLKNPPLLIIEEDALEFDTLSSEYYYDVFWQEMKNSTILTILTQLENLMKYDRVLIFDHGGIVENDSPVRLLKDENSYLYSYIQEHDFELFQRLGRSPEAQGSPEASPRVAVSQQKGAKVVENGDFGVGQKSDEIDIKGRFNQAASVKKIDRRRKRLQTLHKIDQVLGLRKKTFQK